MLSGGHIGILGGRPPLGSGGAAERLPSLNKLARRSRKRRVKRSFRLGEALCVLESPAMPFSTSRGRDPYAYTVDPPKVESRSECPGEVTGEK